MATSLLNFIIVFVFLQFAFIAPPTIVAGIECYVCDGSDTGNPFECSEYFERYGGKPALQPQNCSNVHAARYCVKHVGRFEGGIGAKRYCSSKHMGNYCDYVQNKGDQMKYLSCIHTCDTDGCNAAMPTTTATTTLTHTLLPLLLLTLTASVVGAQRLGVAAVAH